MGKGKEASRVKGNAQASSSARAAQLQGSGFRTFSTFSSDATGGSLGYLGASASADDSALDSQLRMLLNKLKKRDAKTRQKTLVELEEVLAQQTDADTAAVLPHWPRLYSRLSSDSNRRVREATQRVWSVLALRAGKSLAPFLKTTLGPWLLAQHDPHREVARLAKDSFEQVFATPVKREKTLLFGLPELVALLEHNLFSLTLQQLTDQNTGDDANELQDKYERILRGSLAVLSQLMMIEWEKLSACHETFEAIFSNSQLWKLSKHPSLNVQAAVYDLVATVSRHAAHLLEATHKKVATATLRGLEATDPTCLRASWNATLCLLHALPHTYTVISPRKALFPKLWSLVQRGGVPCADVFLPALPVLLSRVPVEVESRVYLLEESLSNLLTALSAPTAAKQLPAREALGCYFELVLLLLDDTSETLSLVTDKLAEIVANVCIDTQLNWLEPALFAERFATCSGKLPTGTAKVVMEKAMERIVGYILAVTSATEPQKTNADAETGPSIDEAETACGPAEPDRIEESTVKGLPANVKLQVQRATTQLSAFANVDLSPAVFACVQAQLYSLLTQVEVLPHHSNVLHLISALEQADVNTELSDSQIAKLEAWLVCCPTLDVATNILKIASKQPQSWLALLTQTTSRLALEDTMQVVDFAHASYPTLYAKAIDAKVFDGLVEQLTNIVANLEAVILNGQTDLELPSRTTFGSLTGLLSPDTVNVLPPARALELVKRLVALLAANVNDINYDGRQALSMAVEPLPLLVVVVDPSAEPSQAAHAAALGSIVLDAWSELLELAMPDSSPCVVGDSQAFDLPSVAAATLEALLKTVSASVVTHRLPTLLEQSVARMQALSLTDEAFRPRSQAIEKLGGLVASSVAMLDDDAKQTLLASAIAGLQVVSFDWASERCNVYSVARGEVVATIDCQPLEQELSGARPEPEVIQALLLLKGALTMVADPASWCLDSHASLAGEFLEQLLLLDGFCGLFSLAGPLLALRVELHAALLVVGSRIIGKDNSELGLGLWQRLWDSMASPSELQFAAADGIHTLLSVLQTAGADSTAILTAATAAMPSSLPQLHALQYTCNTISQEPSAIPSLRNTARRQMDEPLEAAWVSIRGQGEVWLENAEHNTLMLHLANLVAKLEMVCELEQREHDRRLVEDAKKVQTDAGRRAMERQQKIVNSQGVAHANQAAIIVEIIAHLQTWQETDGELVDLDEDSHDELPRVQLLERISLCHVALKVFILAVTYCPGSLTSEHWDMLLCTTLALLSLQPRCCQSRAMLSAAATVWGRLDSLFLRLANEDISDGLKRALVDWNGFFKNDGSALLQTLLQACYTTESTLEQQPDFDQFYWQLTSPSAWQLATTVGAACQTCLKQEEAAQLPFDTVVSKVYSCHSELQLASYVALKHVLTDPAFLEFGLEDEEMEEQEGLVVIQANMDSPSERLLTKLDPLLKALGYDDASSIPQAHAGNVGWLRGHLLLWNALSILFTRLPTELRPPLANQLQHQGPLNETLNWIFEQFLGETRALPKGLAAIISQPSSVPLTTFLEADTGLVKLAAILFANLIARAPAMLRWWADNHVWRRLTNAVQEFNRTYVAPVMVARELLSATGETLESASSTVGIKARMHQNAVVASYSMDSVNIELVITLSPNHPLAKVEITHGTRVGVDAGTWRKWMLQLGLFINYQNGNIIDAVKMWQKNVDKTFEGVEECAVCYAVLHGSNYKLPKTRCRTCKHLFHADCLFKWFSSSGQSTCPLCRSLF
eukprot:m.287134 g.287134  ORF g.287134 m.287134 type:complete len:1758 (-) comp17785_c0_seq1:1352-6625(-)